MVLLIVGIAFLALILWAVITNIRWRKRVTRDVTKMHDLYLAVEATQDPTEKRVKTVEVMRLLEPILFRGYAGRGLIVNLVVALVSWGVALAILGKGIASGIDANRLHQARACYVGERGDCIVKVPGVVNYRDVSGNNNDLYIDVRGQTVDLVMEDSIDSVRVGDHVSLEQWHGAWVYVDSKNGRISTNDNPTNSEFLGLFLGGFMSVLVPAVWLFLWISRRREFLEFRKLERDVEEARRSPDEFWRIADDDQAMSKALTLSRR